MPPGHLSLILVLDEHGVHDVDLLLDAESLASPASDLWPDAGLRLEIERRAESLLVASVCAPVGDLLDRVLELARLLEADVEIIPSHLCCPSQIVCV